MVTNNTSGNEVLRRPVESALAAAVGMQDGSGFGAAAPDRHLQGVDDQFGAHVIGDRPAHDAAVEHIQHRAAVHRAGAGGVLGDVGAPQSVGRVGDELTPYQVVVDRRGGPTATLGPVADAADASDPHQPAHPLAADPHTLPEPQLGVHPRRPIRAPRHGVDVDDGVGQVRIGDIPRRRGPVPPAVVPRP
jgi:hypothetical protein